MADGMGPDALASQHEDLGLGLGLGTLGLVLGLVLVSHGLVNNPVIFAIQGWM